MDAAVPREEGSLGNTHYNMCQRTLGQQSFDEGSRGILDSEPPNRLQMKTWELVLTEVCGVLSELGVPASASEEMSEILKSGKADKRGITWWTGLAR
ncbi:hypothetical protein Cadr_000017331 [Camelus dromedarius]|uniref:Uncharacterized protein n=1 Tax=Camelus dromedarius TaxID=9838 RepID=A0A5N4DHI7_CAMDR|nr:hypothetical protein Cadr_000017331 [Camelus dromedarius]